MSRRHERYIESVPQPPRHMRGSPPSPSGPADHSTRVAHYVHYPPGMEPLDIFDPYPGNTYLGSLSTDSRTWEERKRQLRARISIDDQYEDEYEHWDDGQALRGVSSSPVSMVIFTEWIGSHGKYFSGSDRITEIAGRLHHALKAFLGLFAELEDDHEKGRIPPDTEMEQQFRSGLAVQSHFNSIVSGYKSSFKPITHCSSSEMDSAQELIETMFWRDYKQWKGFLGHVFCWISKRYRAHS
ncbi:hypothetical protein GGS24DRAFT_501593 [Hypoxylon argillaceum]|nr:hypothetical protein GGS24DRAFT_501593 [Hypoxylon argillaceum]